MTATFVPLAATWPAQSVAMVAVSGLYIAGFNGLLRRARSRPGGRRLGLGHVIPFAAGVLLLLVASLPPLASLADDLLSAHMVQHVLLADIAPALLVLGLRSPLLALGMPAQYLRLVAPGGRYGHVWRALTRPWVVLPLWAAAQVSWSTPWLMSAVERSSALHLLQHAALFYTGLLLWWIVVDPLARGRYLPGMGRLVMIGFSRFATAAVCLPLTFLDREMYPSFAASARAHGLAPITDQRLAGAAMCFLEFLVFGIAFAVVFIDALNREERADRLADRASGGRA
jgi:cytochrome c oxidase assembly factor CtaG